MDISDDSGTDAITVLLSSLTWTGVWGVVWPPLPALHPPVVHAVVVDGVSEGHLLVVMKAVISPRASTWSNLIKQQTVLTRLQAHGPVLTLVESVAGVGVSINLSKTKMMLNVMMPRQGVNKLTDS